jgi:hypothetical protein
MSLPSLNSSFLPVPVLVTAAGERALMRFLEFFASNIRNPHTRAYYRAAEEFLVWCASAGVLSIADVQPVHVATWIEAGTRELAAPSVKQRLAAIRHLFDRLVTGQVVPVNPAGSVRGPRHVVTSGQTSVLDPAEARALLGSIDISDSSRAARRSQGPAVPHDRPRHGQANAYRAAADERLCDDPAARPSSAITVFAQLGSRPISRTAARRKGRGDGEPCLDADHTALRSPARRVQPR